jgi:hypothetical protein
MLTEFLLNWGPWVYLKGLEIMETSNNVMRAVNHELYNAKEWIFIAGSSLPISTELFESSQVPERYIRWKATLDPPTFKDPRVTNSEMKHLSYLGFSVIDPGSETSTPIDLSDWINDVKWSGQIQPSPTEIFSLWCCKNRSPLAHYNTGLTVEIITDAGDIIKRGLNDTPHNTIYDGNNAPNFDGQDTQRFLDLVLSSSGR